MEFVSLFKTNAEITTPALDNAISAIMGFSSHLESASGLTHSVTRLTSLESVSDAIKTTIS